MQKTILCFGDSNTWGYDPLTPPYDPATQTSVPMPNRYPRDIRWPGKLQQLLGNDWYVIEEGLNSRTTDRDTELQPNRNATPYFMPCLYSHAPLDWVILSLGLNDFKSYFNKTPLMVKQSLQTLIGLIQQSSYGSNLQEAPKLILLTPPIPLLLAEQYQDISGDFIFQNLINHAKALVQIYQELASSNHCHLIDTSSTITVSSVDGIHYDAKGHEQLALTIFNCLKERVF